MAISYLNTRSMRRPQYMKIGVSSAGRGAGRSTPDWHAQPARSLANMALGQCGLYGPMGTVERGGNVTRISWLGKTRIAAAVAVFKTHGTTANSALPSITLVSVGTPSNAPRRRQKRSNRALQKIRGLLNNKTKQTCSTDQRAHQRFKRACPIAPGDVHPILHLSTPTPNKSYHTITRRRP